MESFVPLSSGYFIAGNSAGVHGKHSRRGEVILVGNGLESSLGRQHLYQVLRKELTRVPSYLQVLRRMGKVDRMVVDPRFLQNLTWTFSKHLLCKECRRAYWFDYVATYSHEIDQITKSKVWKLRTLSTKKFLLGGLVHEVISHFVSQLAKGRTATEIELQSYLAQRIERYRKTARETISEYHNGRPVEQAFFDDLISEGSEQLVMFCRVMWPPLSRLEYTQHEKPEQFHLDDVLVGVKIDLVSKSPDGRIFVVDWKTGTDDPKYENDLQMGVYCLWATSKFDVEVSMISADLCYLKSGKTSSHSFTSGQLDIMRQAVKDEYGEMRKLIGKADNVPNPAAVRCISCKFATICDAADFSGLES